MLERGLVRQEDVFRVSGSEAFRNAMMIFPHESSCSAGSFSKLVTTAIRECIPEELEYLKEKFSGKSIRYGASTHLHTDRSVTFDESIARGGWSSGTSRDHYVFIQLAAMMAPMLSLAGFPDPTVDPVSPSLKPIVDNLSLPAMARLGSTVATKIRWRDIMEYIDKLYLIGIPEFKPNGRLRPLLMAVTASCIMDFEHQVKTYGGFLVHDVSLHMCDALCRTKLVRSWTQAEKILIEWSRAIRHDFETRVASSASGSPKTAKRSHELLLKCHQSLVSLQAEHQRLETKMDTLVAINQRQDTKIDTLVQEFAQHRAKAEATMNAILLALAGGNGANTSVPRLTLSPTQQTDNETRDGDPKVDGTAALPQKRNAFDLLRPCSTLTGGHANKDVGDTLIDHFQSNRSKFRNLASHSLRSLVLPSSNANKKKFE